MHALRIHCFRREQAVITEVAFIYKRAHGWPFNDFLKPCAESSSVEPHRTRGESDMHRIRKLFVDRVIR